MIKAGDTVKIRPEWQDSGDDQLQFIALEDQDGDRVLIGVLGVLTNFIPSQVVLVSMIEGGA